MGGGRGVPAVLDAAPLNWTTGGLVVVGAVALVLLAWQHPANDDEAWFLHVVDRCRMGDLLYRDVFYGAPPLAVWLALLVVRLSRPQLLVLRALVVVYFVVFLLSGVWLLDGVGAPGWMIATYLVGSIAFAGPSWGYDNHYGQLALSASGVALAAIAAMRGDGGWELAAMAGVAAGAAISAKHSLGVITLLATSGLVVLEARVLTQVLVFAVAFSGAISLAAVPVLRAGTIRDLLRRTVGNKSTYLRTGRLGISAAIQEMPLRFPGGGWPRLTRMVATSTLAAVPLSAATAAIGTAVVAGGPPTASRPAAFGTAAAVVALAAAIPRADLPHVQALLPLALAGGLATAHGFAETVDWRVAPTVAAVLAVPFVVWTAIAAIVSLRHATRARRDGVADMDLPHLRGIPVMRMASGAKPSDGAGLRDLTGSRVLLLRPDAAFWYLASDLRNPTAYDFPYASIFGPDGQRETIDRIERGDIRWVCLAEPMAGRMAPDELQRFVLESMEPVINTPAGVLYAMPERVARG